MNLLKLQDDIFNKIIKAKSNYKKSPKDRITLSYLSIRLESLDNLWTGYLENHQKIVLQVEESELDNIGYHDKYDQAEEEYIEFKCMLKDKLLALKSDRPVCSEVSNSNEQKSGPCGVKLPKLTIPKFSGHYSEWPSFRDLFISVIHKNESIDDVQRLHYLKGCLTGEAEQLLRHIPLTADNYSTCWSQLEDRYNNKKYLSNCILKKLTGQKILTSESSNGLKQLLDTTRECLNALKNLSVNIESWDILVIFLVSQRLDSESRKLWEQSNASSPQELPTLKQFYEFLETRFRALEFFDSKPQKSNCTHLVTPTLPCVFCADSHKLCNCKPFAKQNVDARREFVQARHLCFNCLNSGHSVYQCKMSTRCRLCKKKHHTLLHINRNPRVIDQGTPTEQSSNEAVVATVTEATYQPSESTSPKVITTCFTKAHSQVLLATALVDVQSNRMKTTVVLRSLLDQGSQASFITESAVQMLGLNKMRSNNRVTGLGGDKGVTVISKSVVNIKIQSRLDPSFIITVQAHVLDKVTSWLPTRKVSLESISILSSLTLADPTFDTPNKIDLLLGADVYSQILLEGLIKDSPGFLIAQNTKLGWILSGRTIGTANQEAVYQHSITTMHVEMEDSNDLLKKFWELEAEPYYNKKKILTEEEKACESLFAKTTKRDADGRYIVKLPFKSESPLCIKGNSKYVAHKRFLMLESRFKRNYELKKDYTNVINEYLNMGHMELVDDFNSQGVYIPHHAVIRKDRTTTKTRVVFDGSCTDSSGVSLNGELMTGPTLQPELRHLIMRWRCYPISLVADIVKMYRQVKVAEEDTDFQRILWREDPSAEFLHYKLMRVTFGLTSSPYLAVRALQQVVHDEGASYKLASPRVLNDFYMDDLLTGCHSVSEGVQIFKETNEMLKCGGFPLQKWSTNSKELRDVINIEQKNTEGKLELKTDNIMKILGLTWNKETDDFRFTVTLPALESSVTKRKVISDIARLFDPLGWLAPVITKAKIFIQKLWLSNIEWDDELPSNLLDDWTRFRSDLISLTAVSTPRWIHINKENRCIELHGFSDASNLAYAAVVYIRIVDLKGDIHVHLITSKTRVAPIKQLSIPRLELCGAVLLAKLLNEVADTLKIEKQYLHAWTDSTIVLAWLRSHPSRWKTFVANRVSEILTIMDGNQWSHVVSLENPADCASRGLLPSEYVQNRLWKEGPRWLHEKNVIFNKGDIKDTNMEQRKVKIECFNTCQQEGYDILSKFSSLRRLTRVLSYCRRVLLWKNTENRHKEKWLTVEELDEALHVCIRICQRQYFNEEIESLLKKGKLSKRSSLTSLCPFIDSTKVLRVGGRLENANICHNIKHPIIIPHKSHFTILLLREAHERMQRANIGL